MISLNTKSLLEKIATIKLILLAGKAAPSPISGQAFGQYGINIMESCKIYNQQTKNIVASVYIPTTVTIWNNGTFQVLIKTPTTTRILKQTAEFENNAVAKITLKEIYHIGNLKQSDRILSFLCKKAICKMIVGSIKSINSLLIKY